MKILIFSPLELPFVVGARYTGIERLAFQFAEELGHLGHDVSLLAHKDTPVVPPVKLLPSQGYVSNDRTIHAEVGAFQEYSYLFREFGTIHDFGHLHLIARLLPLPVLSMLNNAPEHHQYPKAPYNIISWSKWGVGEFKKYYHQKARYQETIAIDPKVYKPAGKRGDRFLTIGRMSPEKGNLNAILLAEKMGFPLDVVGGRGSEVVKDAPLWEYEELIISKCDGRQIRFLGEVSDGEKIELMQTCRCLLYITNHTELTSHKVQEAMFCGSPVIVPNFGGLPEIVTDGVDGYLCSTKSEYTEAVKTVDNLVPPRTHEAVVKKYHIETVVGDYVKLYQQVADGLRW